MIKTHQTKEEEIGSLPENSIQNNDTKHDLKSWKQKEIKINEPETWTEKMQEMLNKDPEAIKNSQPVMNNAITD